MVDNAHKPSTAKVFEYITKGEVEVCFLFHTSYDVESCGVSIDRAIDCSEIINVYFQGRLIIKGQQKYLTVEGEDRHKRHRHVTILPIKRQVTDQNESELTKIELELEEAPDNGDRQESRLAPILVGPMPTELDSTTEINSTHPHAYYPGSSGAVVVRAEEALIVVFVLVLWVGAIALFFNRWGKIRMLEPYQPKFQQQHRPSCAISDPAPLSVSPAATALLRTCSKFNIHCLEHPLYPSGESQRPRQNSVLVGSSVSLLGSDQNTPRRAKSAFDLQSLVLAECSVQNSMDEQDDTIDPEFVSCGLSQPQHLQQQQQQHQQQQTGSNRRLKPFNEYPKLSRSFQRERGASICHFDRTDVLARPLQRERGMSICQFDRMDVLARPLQRDRGMSICHFDRMDVLAHPSNSNSYKGSRASIISNAEKLENLGRSLQRESRSSMFFNNSVDKPLIGHVENFRSGQHNVKDSRLNVSSLERPDNMTRFLHRDSRASLGNNDRAIVENLGRNFAAGQSAGSIVNNTRDKNLNATNVCPYDRPSCSKTPDVVLGYKATCV